MDQDTVNAIATEFTDLLDAIGLTAPGNVDAALEALAVHFSPHLADKLRDQLDNRSGRAPFIRLQNMTTDEVVRILSSENIQIGAVLLSKLPVSSAAEVLGKLPGDARGALHSQCGRPPILRRTPWCVSFMHWLPTIAVPG